MLAELATIFFNDERSLADAFDAYLDFTERTPWDHSLWMHAGEVHPDLDRILTTARHC